MTCCCGQTKCSDAHVLVQVSRVRDAEIAVTTTQKALYSRLWVHIHCKAYLPQANMYCAPLLVSGRTCTPAMGRQWCYTMHQHLNMTPPGSTC